MAAAPPGSPEWWRDRLYTRIHRGQTQRKDWDAWYNGDHPAPESYAKASNLLKPLLAACGANFLAALVDAAHERMHVEGFKVAGKINDAVWEIWQGNDLDAGSEQVFLEQMVQAYAYLLVDPSRNAAGYPTVTPEHPSQCIHEHEPGSRRLAAGLKTWTDDLGERPVVHAVLYLPAELYWWTAPSRTGRGMAMRPGWELQQSLSGENPLGEVPLVPFVNRPRMLAKPVPEFWPAVPVQRRVNQTLLDRLVMQYFGAFKQKWATGLQIPEGPNGEPKEDFMSAIDRVFTNENPAGKYGQFEAEDITMMLKAVDADAKHMATLVPTPPDYLLGEMVNVSAEGLKAAQASLVSRVRRHMRHAEEPLETAARLMLKAAGKRVPKVSSMTTVWRNPEFRTEGEMVDAGVKALSAGMPEEAVWEKYFQASPPEIAEWSQKAAARRADPTLERIARDLAGDGGAPADRS